MPVEKRSIVRRPQALADGWSDGELRVLRRRGQLVTMKAGRYVHPEDIADCTAEDTHRLRLHACDTTPSYAISHLSAAVAWELPIVRGSLERVHLTRHARTGARRQPGQHCHSGLLDREDVRPLNGIWVTSAARTLVDVARTESEITALAVADAALHRGMLTADELAIAVGRMPRAHGAPTARRLLALADGRSESPAESWLRLNVGGLIPLDAQVEIRDEDGAFLARADLGCREAMLLIEVDGRGKYGALLAEGMSTVDVVLAEKKREDSVRALGYIIVRVTWDELLDRDRLCARIMAAYRRGRSLVARGQRPLGSYQPLPRIGL